MNGALRNVMRLSDISDSVALQPAAEAVLVDLIPGIAVTKAPAPSGLFEKERAVHNVKISARHVRIRSCARHQTRAGSLQSRSPMAGAVLDAGNGMI